MSTAQAVLGALFCLVVNASICAAADDRASSHLIRGAAGTPKLQLQEFGPAKVPSGYVNLCAREPAVCAPEEPAAQTYMLSQERWQLINDINLRVNHDIVAESDQEQYGQLEYWTFPVKAGDCEDYVLLKRKDLMEAGMPESSLLITVVLDENGEGHAVLTIPTTSGDFVLDNRRDEVRLWRYAGYTFLKRQSSDNPNAWVSLTNEKLQATNFASGPEAQ